MCNREKLISDFQCSLNDGRVILFFQAIIDRLCAERVLYEECLMRISGLEASSTGAVIGALEQSGMIRELDHLVVGAALEVLMHHQNLRIGCNLSACSLWEDEHWEALILPLRKRADIASKLTLEITETASFLDIEAAVRCGRILQDMGCQVAIDDFDASKSRLQFARRLCPDVVKIDASFLWAARASEKGMDKLWCLTTLSKSLAPAVVIEGVENEADVQIAQQLDIKWLQGFGISRPASKSPPIRLRGA